MNCYRIPEMAQKYIDYDMIQKYTELPQFPEIRTRILYAFLNKNNVLQQYSELFSLVTSLVQLGLDTHDTVSITNQAKDMKSARSRQIKVLAGDYFSARFYYLLAEAGHIAMIGTLSDAICEANRLKIVFYQTIKGLSMTSEEYVAQSVEIRSRIYMAFSKLMDESLNKVWPEILRLFTQCELLLQEIVKPEKQQLPDSWSFGYMLQQVSKEERRNMQLEEPDPSKVRSIWMKYNISSQLYQLLEITTRQLKDKLQTLDNKELSQELISIGEPFERYLSTPKVLEEI
ncbi:heptaprenyl diphosphate synthase [Paenibacillus sp. 1_12]|nr:heptaprenyl diphosphate synthase [Paenibacillus sp. 1_12]